MSLWLSFLSQISIEPEFLTKSPSIEMEAAEATLLMVAVSLVVIPSRAIMLVIPVESLVKSMVESPLTKLEEELALSCELEDELAASDAL